MKLDKMRRLAVAILFLPTAILARQTPAQKDSRVDAAMREQITDAVRKSLEEEYVIPDLATKVIKDLNERVSRGEYDRFTSAVEFAQQLTADLQSVSHDKHLRVLYHEPSDSKEATSSEEARKLQQLNEKAQNYGFDDVGRLPGNVGYLKIKSFAAPPQSAGEKMMAAMSFLSDTNALIIDVRGNRGGHPPTVQVVCSFLFPEGGTHLNDVYGRAKTDLQQYWTLPYLPMPRYDKPIYVLTSSRTFSGAEEFAYDLQSTKRAIIVGETTEGGAHPVHSIDINDYFTVTIPGSESINPITKTSWEAVGVKPDFPVAAEEALKQAQIEALKEIAKQQLTPPLAREVRDAAKALESK